MTRRGKQADRVPKGRKHAAEKRKQADGMDRRKEAGA